MPLIFAHFSTTPRLNGKYSCNGHAIDTIRNGIGKYEHPLSRNFMNFGPQTRMIMVLP